MKLRTKKYLIFHGEEKSYKNGQKWTKNRYCVNPSFASDSVLLQKDNMRLQQLQ